MVKRDRVSDIPPFGLRMQSKLKERIEKEVADNGRSQNAEIVARLEWSFKNNAAFKADSAVAVSPVTSELESLRALVRALETRLYALEKKVSYLDGSGEPGHEDQNEET